MANTKQNQTKVKRSHLWLRDASGEQSVTVTLIAVAFFVTTIAYVLSIFGNIDGMQIRAFDVGACAAYLSPILALYGARKFTDAKYAPDAPVALPANVTSTTVNDGGVAITNTAGTVPGGVSDGS